ncbi:MAG: FAD-dependent oxidoreductase [Ruminococcaceae bacterium]|nr:FAD-dependent oxidoreductase [Oscillospiraceae bacterium]
MIYDTIIIGAGPAGLTAAIYLRRANKNVLVLEKETFGGQITHSPKVENYPGFLSVSGAEFADKLVEQAMSQGADIDLDEAKGITKENGIFTVKGTRCDYTAKSVVIATGSKHRTLGLKNEEKFTGEGISYCAVCDGAFYKDNDIAVIGGGNSALQEAILLAKTSKSVTVIQNLPFLTGESKLIEQIEAADNISVIFSSVVTKILGDEKFRGITVKNEENGKETDLSFDGIFVAIGQQPENESFKDAVSLDERGYITADESCIPDGESGIFVAGDCRSKAVRQIATAVSDGAAASVAVCRYLG